MGQDTNSNGHANGKDEHQFDLVIGQVIEYRERGIPRSRVVGIEDMSLHPFTEAKGTLVKCFALEAEDGLYRNTRWSHFWAANLPGALRAHFMHVATEKIPENAEHLRDLSGSIELTVQGKGICTSGGRYIDGAVAFYRAQPDGEKPRKIYAELVLENGARRLSLEGHAFAASHPEQDND